MVERCSKEWRTAAEVGALIKDRQVYVNSLKELIKTERKELMLLKKELLSIGGK